MELQRKWQGETEVIIVDDGSDDGTIQKIDPKIREEITLITIAHQGKGEAVKQGVLRAKGDKILFSDIDWSVPVEQVIEMLLLDSDIVIASREIKGARRIAEPPWRHLVGKFFNRWVQWMLLSGYEDTQCGCKIFQHQVAQRIFSRTKEKGWAFDVEVLVLAHVFGILVTEFPVSWQYQSSSKIVILRDGTNMARAVLRIKRRLLRGDYNENIENKKVED